MSIDHFIFILRILKLQNSPKCNYSSINIGPLVEMSYRLIIRVGGLEITAIDITVTVEPLKTCMGS